MKEDKSSLVPGCCYQTDKRTSKSYLCSFMLKGAWSFQAQDLVY